MTAPVISSFQVPVLDEDGKLPASVLPAGGSVPAPTVTAVTIGTGFAAPSWGVTPSVSTDTYAWTFAGHIARGAADLIANAVIATGGSWPAGEKVVAVTSTGTLLLRSTATTLEVDQLLSGAAPEWVSLDGVLLR